MRRSVLRLHAAAVAVALLAGCSSRGDPAPPPPPPPANPPGGGGAPAPPVTQVREPWAPGMRQHGVAVYWENSPTDPDQVVRVKAEKILDHIVSLGANSVSISFSFVMDSARASAVRSDTPLTPSPERLGIVLEEAHRRLLRTTVRPMLHERNLTRDDPDMWRGSIQPANRDRWFGSYRDMLLPYAEVAESAGVATFVIGTELNSMERHAAGWRTVVKGLRTAYRGDLDYSANHDRLSKTGPAPGVTRSVDAYPPLKLGDRASVDELMAGWDDWLDEGRGRGKLSDLVLAEVAIGARAGAYRQPWSPHPNGTIRPEIQQRWFDTACRVMQRRDLAGVYFWMINLDADPTAAPADRSPMEFTGRPAERNIARCFARTARRT